MSSTILYKGTLQYDTWEYTYYLYLEKLIDILCIHFPERIEEFNKIEFKMYFFKYIFEKSSKKLSDTDKKENYINFLIDKNGHRRIF
jgi:hypothetical protein